MLDNNEMINENHTMEVKILNGGEQRKHLFLFIFLFFFMHGNKK